MQAINVLLLLQRGFPGWLDLSSREKVGDVCNCNFVTTKVAQWDALRKCMSLRHSRMKNVDSYGIARAQLGAISSAESGILGPNYEGGGETRRVHAKSRKDEASLGIEHPSRDYMPRRGLMGYLEGIKLADDWFPEHYAHAVACLCGYYIPILFCSCTTASDTRVRRDISASAASARRIESTRFA